MRKNTVLKESLSLFSSYIGLVWLLVLLFLLNGTGSRSCILDQRKSDPEIESFSESYVGSNTDHKDLSESRKIEKEKVMESMIQPYCEQDSITAPSYEDIRQVKDQCQQDHFDSDSVVTPSSSNNIYSNDNNPSFPTPSSCQCECENEIRTLNHSDRDYSDQDELDKTSALNDSIDAPSIIPTSYEHECNFDAAHVNMDESAQESSPMLTSNDNESLQEEQNKHYIMDKGLDLCQSKDGLLNQNQQTQSCPYQNLHGLYRIPYYQKSSKMEIVPPSYQQQCEPVYTNGNSEIPNDSFLPYSSCQLYPHDCNRQQLSQSPDFGHADLPHPEEINLHGFVQCPNLVGQGDQTDSCSSIPQSKYDHDQIRHSDLLEIVHKLIQLTESMTKKDDCISTLKELYRHRQVTTDPSLGQRNFSLIDHSHHPDERGNSQHGRDKGTSNHTNPMDEMHKSPSNLTCPPGLSNDSFLSPSTTDIIVNTTNGNTTNSGTKGLSENSKSEVNQDSSSSLLSKRDVALKLIQSTLSKEGVLKETEIHQMQDILSSLSMKSSPFLGDHKWISGECDKCNYCSFLKESRKPPGIPICNPNNKNHNRSKVISVLIKDDQRNEISDNISGIGNRDGQFELFFSSLPDGHYLVWMNDHKSNAKEILGKELEVMLKRIHLITVKKSDFFISCQRIHSNRDRVPSSPSSASSIASPASTDTYLLDLDSGVIYTKDNFYFLNGLISVFDSFDQIHLKHPILGSLNVLPGNGQGSGQGSISSGSSSLSQQKNEGCQFDHNLDMNEWEIFLKSFYTKFFKNPDVKLLFLDGWNYKGPFEKPSYFAIKRTDKGNTRLASYGGPNYPYKYDSHLRHRNPYQKKVCKRDLVSESNELENVMVIPKTRIVTATYAKSGERVVFTVPSDSIRLEKLLRSVISGWPVRSISC